ncbi:LamG domain-containing protein, partial [bacterium]
MKKQITTILLALTAILLLPKFVMAANINFTLETWVEPATSIATKAILVKDDEVRLVTDASGYLLCQIHNGVDWQTAATSDSTALSLATWAHVACTYDGANIKVYIDSVEEGSQAMTEDVDNTANVMHVGHDAGATYGKFEGQIDSVRIFNRALSANEIRAHYDLGSVIQDGNMEDGDVGEWFQSDDTSELVTGDGGDFDTDDGYWSIPGGLGCSITGGKLVYAGPVGSDVNVSKASLVTIGKIYKTVFTLSDYTSGQFRILIGGSGYGTFRAANGTYTEYITASGSTRTYLQGDNNGADFIGKIDNVSIWEVQFVSAESGIVADEDGLVGGWNFSEGGASATTVDVSGNGNTGTLQAGDDTGSNDSATDMWSGGTSGRFGQAIEFDGTNDYVNVGDAENIRFGTNNFTISAWIKMPTSASNRAIASVGRYGADEWFFVHSTLSNSIKLYAGAGNINLPTTTDPRDGIWHHVTVTRNNSNGYIYFDGIEENTQSGITCDLSSTVGLKIGNSSATEYFDGSIDSVRIYNRALSASEIANHYYSGRNKFDDYTAKIKLSADDSNSYLDENLTLNQDYLLSYYYKVGEDNSNPIMFTLSGSGAIVAEENIMASSTTGLVGAWNFEEAISGDDSTVVDISGTGNDGLTKTGDASWVAGDRVAGKYGYAYDFNGGTDDRYIDMGDSTDWDDLDAMSFEMWFNSNTFSGTNQLGGNYDNDDKDSGFVIYWYDDDLVFVIYDGAMRQCPVSFTTTGEWTHVIGVAPGSGNGTLKIYVNSVETTGASQTGVITNSADNVIIGANADTGDRYFDGTIDSVRIYNRALTASEVYDSYKAGDWRKYELSFEADQTGAHLFKFIQDGATSGNSIVYVDNFRVDKDLVENGSMEGTYTSGVVADWAEVGSTSTPSESADEHTGAKAQAVLAGDTSNNVAQTVTVVSGNWYTFGAYAKVDSGTGYIELSGADTETIEVTSLKFKVSKNNQDQISKTFKATTTSLVIELYADSGKTIIVDDVSIIELDSYTGATTATTTTPSTATNSYGNGRWWENTSSLMIDGGDVLTYPTANNMYDGEGSVAFWIKPEMDYDDYEENKYLWSLEDFGRIYYNYSDYKFYWEIYDGSAWDSVQAVSSAQTFTEDTWIHVAGTWNDRKNEVDLSIDGSNDGSSTWAWYAQSLPTNMYFGAEYDGTNGSDMYMDDLRVYDHALSTEDIKRVYGSETDPSADTLQIQIPFTSGGAGIDGSGIFDLVGTFTAGWGSRTGKVSGESALMIAGADDLQFSRGSQVDGNIYEYISPYQGTIKTWVQPALDGDSATTHVIYQNGSSNYLKLYYASGTLYWDIYDGTTTHRVSNSVSDWTNGTWYHIVATWSNESAVNIDATQYLMNLYEDGSDSGNSYSNATFNTNFWANFAPGTSFIGEDSSSANQWDGLIGGFVMDNYVWSEDEVATDYDSGAGVVSVVAQDTLMYLPADSSDIDGMITSDKTPDVAVADGNMEDGDVAEWTDAADAYSSAESGIVTAEDGLVGGWNFEDDLTDDSGNSNTGVSHTDPDCPTGYVFVPGNSTYNTSDFCVMQYEAKYDKSGDLDGDNATTYSCIANSGDGWDWRDSECATGGTVVSTANGSPIVHITHTQALTSCPVGDHIITNDEWMTIARDAEQVNANWTNGEIGDG